MVPGPLKGYKSFETVLRSGRRVTSGPLLFAVIPNEDSEQSLLGVGVPKRIAPKAVVRNRIKRLMRESAQLCFQDLNSALRGIRVVCLCRQAPRQASNVRLADIHKYMSIGLQKLARSETR